MPGTRDPIALRRKSFHGLLILYGLILAGLVLILKYFEYRYLVRELSVEVYISVVATLFTALGIWVGSKLLQRGPAPPQEAFPKTDPEHARKIGLSGREFEVLQLIAKGRTNQEIADQLFISLATVKSHSSNLFIKLDVKRRTEAVHKARSLGIIA